MDSRICYSPLATEGKNIPSDIIVEILSWLPARSVIRFWSVCRLWHSITHETSFIDTHLQRAPKKIVAFSHDYSSSQYGISIVDNAARLLFNRPLLRPWNKNYIVTVNGSSNGLLCVAVNDESIQIINPATRETLALPKVPNVSRYRIFHRFHFGFHPETKEYKIVDFFNHVDNQSVIEGCNVYTLGTNSWRQIGNLPIHSLPRNRPATANGAIYWLFTGAEHNESSLNSKEYSVVSLDLKDESFTKISLPNLYEIYGDKSYNYSLCNIMELQDSVCFPVLSRRRPVDIWLLITTTVATTTKHEWTRKFSVNCSFSGPDIVSSRSLIIGGDFVMFIKEFLNYGTVAGRKNPLYSLVCHHFSRDGGIQRIRYDDYKGDEHWQPLAHVESLVQLGEFEVTMQ